MEGVPHEKGWPSRVRQGGAERDSIHQLLVLAPFKKTISALEKIQRGFLWAERTEANGGNCHVNCRHISRPILLGGLGVRDLECAGLKLHTRWLWFCHMDNTRAWASLDM